MVSSTSFLSALAHLGRCLTGGRLLPCLPFFLECILAICHTHFLFSYSAPESSAHSHEKMRASVPMKTTKLPSIAIIAGKPVVWNEVRPIPPARRSAPSSMDVMLYFSAVSYLSFPLSIPSPSLNFFHLLNNSICILKFFSVRLNNCLPAEVKKLEMRGRERLVQEIQVYSHVLNALRVLAEPEVHEIELVAAEN